MDKNRRTIDGLSVRDKSVPRRQLGFQDGRTVRLQTREHKESVASRRINVVAEDERPKIAPDKKEEIAEFLAEARDGDPTDLSDDRESRREERKPREKKAAREPRERRRSWKWFILVPIILVLFAIVANIFVVEMGWWNVQEKMMNGDTSLPVIIAAGLNIVWNIGELAILRWVLLALVIGLVVLAAWNGKEIFGKKKSRVVLIGSIVTIVALVGVVAWKGVSIWNQLNDALSAMTGGRVSIGAIQDADSTVPLKKDINGRTNILVYGTSGYEMDSSNHDGFRLADTILVISLNQDAGDVKTFSIPRDLYSEKRCTATGKMNETYFCEYQKFLKDPRYNDVKDNPTELAKLHWEYEEKAAENFMAVIGKITGLDIQYWAHVNWGAVISVVDALGGLDVAIEYEGNKDNYKGDLPVIWTTDPRGIKDNIINFKAGTVQHLDGATALELGRSRNSNTNNSGQYGLDANWGREKTQQVLIEAIATKAKTTNFVSNLDTALTIIQSLGDNLRMNFDAEGIRRGIYLAGELDVTGMQSIDIKDLFRNALLNNGNPCTLGEAGCRSYVVPKAGTFNYSAIAAYIDKKLKSNGFEEEAAVVDVLNGTLQTGLAAKIAQEMGDLGYTVGVIGNTPEGKEYEKTVIYKIGEAAKPATEKALMDKFGVSLINVNDLPDGITSTASFVVILGQNAVK